MCACIVCLLRIVSGLNNWWQSRAANFPASRCLSVSPRKCDFYNSFYKPINFSFFFFVKQFRAFSSTPILFRLSNENQLQSNPLVAADLLLVMLFWYPKNFGYWETESGWHSTILCDFASGKSMIFSSYSEDCQHFISMEVLAPVDALIQHDWSLA